MIEPGQGFAESTSGAMAVLTPKETDSGSEVAEMAGSLVCGSSMVFPPRTAATRRGTATSYGLGLFSAGGGSVFCFSCLSSLWVMWMRLTKGM